MAKLGTKALRYSSALQITPLGITLALFLLGPIVVIGVMSFYEFTGFMTVPAFTLENYIDLFTSSLTAINYIQTLKMVAITWAITLVLGFTLAYFLVFDLILLRVKLLLFLLCVVPFWTSSVVRMVAWVPFLGKEGIINRALIGLGISDEPLEFLLYSEFAVFLSYVQIFTLFMMAPLFNVMARINRDLIEAAKDNGASSWQILWNVIIPLCKPGIAIGTIFVMSLVVSDFATLGLLGGQRIGTVSVSMLNQINMAQYPPSSATGLLLLVVVLLIVAGIMRVVDVRKQL